MSEPIDSYDLVQALSMLSEVEVENILIGPCKKCGGSGRVPEFNKRKLVYVKCDRCGGKLRYQFNEPTYLALGIIKLIKDQ